MTYRLDLDDIKIQEGSPPRRPRSAPKEGLFAKLWLWQLDLLLEKRATGQYLRLFLVLARQDFADFGNKTFTVTGDMVKAAGVDRHAKGKILQDFEQWGLIFLERPGARKNPRVYLRKLQGRGENPFLNCG